LFPQFIQQNYISSTITLAPDSSNLDVRIFNTSDLNNWQIIISLNFNWSMYIKQILNTLQPKGVTGDPKWDTLKEALYHMYSNYVKPKNSISVARG